jgi:hypothetical protein
MNAKGNIFLYHLGILCKFHYQRAAPGGAIQPWRPCRSTTNAFDAPFFGRRIAMECAAAFFAQAGNVKFEISFHFSGKRGMLRTARAWSGQSAVSGEACNLGLWRAFSSVCS